MGSPSSRNPGGSTALSDSACERNTTEIRTASRTTSASRRPPSGRSRGPGLGPKWTGMRYSRPDCSAVLIAALWCEWLLVPRFAADPADELELLPFCRLSDRIAIRDRGKPTLEGDGHLLA